MTGSFQQQARIRKLTYIGLIIALFFTTLFLRRGVIETRAAEMELREQSQGDVDLTGSAVYLSLSGSRGLVVCYLWVTAKDKQARHEWNELELIVNSLTKLQPHFITPWQFQGWNLSYNVSVECDRVKDKYFYVTRGIDMLSRGQRRNRDNPDLRNDIGFFYQNKIGIADEQNTFRSLFQISCIDPRERDPKRFRRIVGGESEINFAAFEDFCKQHPFLVRRLRDKLACDKPDRIIDFLDDNARIPSLYDDKAVVAGLAQTPLKPVLERFPLLPPRSDFDPKDLNIDDQSTLSDEIDNYDLARTWYGFAQDPVERKGRKPRMLSKIIFLGNPARAQSYRAERLEQAGWFDEDGWTIRDWFPKGENTRAMREVTVPARGRPWAAEAWGKAFDMYERHGLEHGLLYPLGLAALTPEQLADYQYGRHVTNFEHFYEKSKAERLPQTISGRKQFFLADQLRGSPREALQMYRHPAAFGDPVNWSNPNAKIGWKKVLVDNPGFRRDLDIQVEAYELQTKYLELERDLPGCLGEQVRDLVAWQNVLGQAVTGAATPTVVQLGWLVAPGFNLPLRGPLDVTIADSPGGPQVPLISPEAVERVRGRLEQKPRSAKPSPGNQPGPRPAAN